MIYNRQSKALSTSLVKWKLTPYTWKNKQTNKQKQKNTYLETSEFNTKEEFLKPLSTGRGDREKNEVTYNDEKE